MGIIKDAIQKSCSEKGVSVEFLNTGSRVLSSSARSKYNDTLRVERGYTRGVHNARAEGKKCPPLYLDIMQEGRFVCQLKYTDKPALSLIDGDVIPTYDSEEIRRFVYEQLPSLSGKNINILFSKQRLIKELRR